MLAGSAGNAFGASQCSNDEIAGYVGQYLNSWLGGDCSQQAGVDAVTCYQNQCLAKYNNECNGVICKTVSLNTMSNCYNQGCASTACPIPSSQFSQFVQFYSGIVRNCGTEIPDNINKIIMAECADATTGKRVPCPNQTSSK